MKPPPTHAWLLEEYESGKLIFWMLLSCAAYAQRWQRWLKREHPDRRYSVFKYALVPCDKRTRRARRTA